MKKLIHHIIFPLLLLLALWPVAAWGHGGGRPQIVREPAGPFLVSVWSLPDPLTVGEVNLIVLVTSSEEGSLDQYVLDADIGLALTHDRSGEVVTAQATHDEAVNKLFYESYFDVESGGGWTGEVTVTAGGQSGTAEFPLEIEGPEPAGINWTLYGGIAVAVVAGGWFLLQARRRPPTADRADSC